MMMRSVLLIAAGVGSGVRAQPFCNDALLAVSAQLQTVCCEDAASCRDGVPSTCSSECAAIWVPYVEECAVFLDETFGAQFTAFSALCLDVSFGVDAPCDPAYAASGRLDVRSACCGNGARCDANGFPTGDCDSACKPVFEQYFARCADAVKQSGYTSQQYQDFTSSCHAGAAAHDDCGSGPCQNGADCQSNFVNGGYTCTCASGFEGANCEHTLTETCSPGTLETAQWRGDYFSHPDLDEGGSRRPHHSVCEDTIPHYDWGDGAPERMPKSRDNFSVRWTSDVTLVAGTYELTVTSDDGSRVLIDGVVVLDHWLECCDTWSTRVSLPAGQHQVVYEYREEAGGANAALDITFITHGIVQVTRAQVESGEVLQGEIDVAGSHQQYRFTADESVTYSVDAQRTGIPGMTVTLYDTDDVTVLASGNNFEWTALASGSNLVQIEGSSPTDTGSYTLTITSSGGPCGPGGQRIDATEAGQILFYDVPHAAENNVGCEWHLFCEEGQTVNLAFGRFDTESGYDFVNIYDGISTANALLGSYSGTTPPVVGATTGSTMLVTFETDGSILGHGFDARFSCSGDGIAATELNMGPPARMSLGRGEVGVYVFEAVAGTTYIISLRPTPGHDADVTGTPSFRLLDDNHQQLDQVIVSADSGILTFSCATTGAYRIVVSSGVGDGGDFMLSYTESGDACTGGSTRVFPTHDGVIDRESLPLGTPCTYIVNCLPGETVLMDLQDSRDFVAISDQGSVLQVPASGIVTSSGQSITLTATATDVNQILKVSHGCRGGDILAIEVGTGARVSSIDRSPGPPGMEQQFQFTAVGGITYQLDTELLGLPDSVMTLYDTDARTVLAENDDNPAQGGGLSSYIEWTCPRDGTYVVGVRGFNPSQSGEFSLSITELQASGSPCQGSGLDLPTPTGTIDFFDGTSEGQDCNWHLDCGAGQTATVTFGALATEAGYDFVWIFDGDSHDNTVITQLDGYLGDPCSSGCGPYSSTGSRITVAFTSDSSVNNQGFRASYTCSGQGDDALPPLVTTDGTPVPGNILHPGEQVYYRLPAEAGHTYQIETQLDGLPDTVLDLLDVDAETQLLTNDDAPGGASLSSAIEWTCPTTGTYYIMVRAYDPLSQTGGFLLVVTEATAAGGDDPCAGGVNLPRRGGVIDYFAGHPDGVECSWRVDCPVGLLPSVTFTQFDTEANFDFVQMWYTDSATGDADVRLSGTFAADGDHPPYAVPTHSAYVSTTNSLTLQFTADGSVSGQGFVADYSCGEERALPPAVDFDVPQTGTFADGSQVSYAISATAGDAYDISTESAADVTVTLYDLSETQLFQNSGGRIEWLCAVTGQYIIDLSVSQLALGPPPSFTLTVSQGPSHCYTNPACHNPNEEHSTACLMANVAPLRVSSQEGDITLLVPGRGTQSWDQAAFPDSTGCAWQFACPAGQHVLLEATRMDLEACCDWIDVYDSNEIPQYEDDRFPSESASTLLKGPQSADAHGTWSGAIYTGSRLESSGPVMSMAFHADENVMLSGFDIHYSCVDGAAITSCAVGEWLEQFWGANDPGDGEPLYSACIGQDSINYDWGGGGPEQLGGAITDNFAGRWTGTIMLYDPADGTREQPVDVIFAAHSDDGSRIYIDGVLVLDHWADCCTTWYTNILTLSPGPHNIIYEMRENGGGAYAELTWEIVSPTEIPDCPPGQWTALYWSNPNMDGEPDAADCVNGEVNFNFDEMGGGPPQLPTVTDNFSVRWSATLPFARGSYIFHSHSDDGSRVSVNGNVVLDHWGDCCSDWDSEPVELQGNVDIIYEMRENGGGANAHVWWSEVPPPAVCTESQWSAAFFDNNQLEGAPRATGCADAIDFDFDALGGGPPELGSITDNFSIRWTRVVTFAAGNYHFTARSDDGSRVFVDGQSVLDHWGECCATWVSDDVPIEAGDHAVVFEFYENGGGAYASLSWEAAAGGASITVAGDNRYELWLNGEHQGSGDEWTTATTYSVAIDEDYLANQEAVIAIHGTDAGAPGAIIAVASQGANTYLTGVDNWYCWSSPDGTDAAPPGDWALPGYDFIRSGFQPAITVAQYGTGAWGATDLCAAGQCRDKAMFTDASWIWSSPLASTGIPSLFAYCRLSLGVSSVVVVDPPPPANPTGENDTPCRGSSSESCTELGWPVRAGTGFDSVCAASTAVGCVAGATFTAAQQTCEQAGGRLCTADEILAHVTQGSGCSFDNQRIWTSDRSVVDPEQKCATNAYVTMRGTGANSGLAGDWPVMCTPVDEQAAVRCCADANPSDGACNCPPGSWLARYYQSSDAQLATADVPAIAADVQVCQLGISMGETISYQWGGGGPVQLPGVTDHFTVRWSGSVIFAPTERGWPIITFTASSDDGSRLWVDGTMVLDHISECCSTWTTEPAQLSSDVPHDIVYVMQENGGGAYAVLEWSVSSTRPPPPPPPPPPPRPGGGCSLDFVAIGTGVGTGAAYSTYQAVVTLGPTAANIYTIFGSSVGQMDIPPAFQVATPFGVDLGGTNPQFWQFNPDAQFDSWLTVGLTQGENANALSSVGIDLANWDLDHGITTTDGAVFWMNPDDGPSTSTAVVAQLTVPISRLPSITLCAQGRIRDGGDWQECLATTATGNTGGGGH